MKPYAYFWPEVEVAREHFLNVIIDRKWPPKKKNGNCPHQSEIKIFFANY